VSLAELHTAARVTGVFGALRQREL